MTNKIRLPHFLKSLLALSVLLPLPAILADDRVEVIGINPFGNFPQGQGYGYLGGPSSYGSGPDYIFGVYTFFMPGESGTTYWALNVRTGNAYRAGLYKGDEFSSSSPYTIVNGQNSSGYMTGHSARNGGPDWSGGTAGWMLSAETGETIRVGLYHAPEFSATSGQQISFIKPNSLTHSGYVVGGSVRYSGNDQNGAAAWVASFHTGESSRVGLFEGTEFTSSVGMQQSTVLHLTENARVAGFSTRYNGANESGQAAWVADAVSGVTKRIGFFEGAEFTSSEGVQYSSPERVSVAGHVLGYSTRYDDAAENGRATWLADATTGNATRIGLFAEPEFTSSTGYQYSTATNLTESGYAWGYSTRYTDATENGQAAWVAGAAAGTTYRIGLSNGAEFTRNDGYQSSTVNLLTESGLLQGYSTRYSGSTENGQASWMARAATGSTTRIGLFSGAEFTRQDGYQLSTVTHLTESGYLQGHSTRYHGANENGQAAWVASAAAGSTTRVGLFSGAEFTREDDFQSSTVQQLTESGYLRGTSTRYNGSTENGQAAWVAKAATGETARVGLTNGPEFTSTSGLQYSVAEELTEGGYARGYSTRYNGESVNGRAAWVGDAASGTTTRVGLLDATHTGSDDYQYSYANDINGMGLVTGSSARYNDQGVANGSTAWVFDLTTETYVTFDLYVRSSDGYSASAIQGITSDGFVYGRMTLFDEETSLEDRFFVWTMSTGTVVLDMEINGRFFYHTANMAFPGGVFVSNAGLEYYAVRVVPEPATALLVLLGLGGMMARRQRRR